MGTTVQAQTQKGNVMVGANMANILGTFSSDANSFQFNLTPKAGWFIKDNLALGAEVNLGIKTTKYDNTDTKVTDLTYGIGAFGRYYITDESIEFSKRARFFLEASAGFNGTNSKTKVADGSSSSINNNGLGLGFGPGLAFFITPNVALEALLKYDITVGFGSSTTVHKLGLNLGFQIYLPGKNARQIIREETGK